jgi:hypothetical protein
MSEWQHGRRQYGPHCQGTASQHHGRASWDLRFLQFVEGLDGSYAVELKKIGWDRMKTQAEAEAACDAQVAAWQQLFPMLEIVAKEEKP